MRSLMALPLLLASLTTFAADKPGSADLELVPRFHNAEIVDFRNAESEERRYPLGAIRRIGGDLRFEGEVLAHGALRSLTYQIPSEYQATDAFEATRNALLDQGAHLLYWCVARDCGSSSLWANAVFGRASLYGPDEGQSYALMRFTQGDADTLFALYAITRGNRRAYLQVDQFTPDEALGLIRPTSSTLLRQLRHDGELVIPDISVDDPDWQALLTRTLRMDSTLRIALDGRDAMRWREVLIEQNIRQNRIEVDDALRSEMALEIKVIR